MLLDGAKVATTRLAPVVLCALSVTTAWPLTTLPVPTTLEPIFRVTVPDAFSAEPVMPTVTVAFVALRTLTFAAASLTEVRVVAFVTTNFTSL